LLSEVTKRSRSSDANAAPLGMIVSGTATT
jgi:hypothetical protein